MAAAIAMTANGRATQAQKPTTERPTYTMLVHPGTVMLDLVGPMTAFNLTMGEMRLVWKDKKNPGRHRYRPARHAHA